MVDVQVISELKHRLGTVVGNVKKLKKTKRRLADRVTLLEAKVEMYEDTLDEIQSELDQLHEYMSERSNERRVPRDECGLPSNEFADQSNEIRIGGTEYADQSNEIQIEGTEYADQSNEIKIEGTEYADQSNERRLPSSDFRVPSTVFRVPSTKSQFPCNDEFRETFSIIDSVKSLKGKCEESSVIEKELHKRDSVKIKESGDFSSDLPDTKVSETQQQQQQETEKDFKLMQVLETLRNGLKFYRVNKSFRERCSGDKKTRIVLRIKSKPKTKPIPYLPLIHTRAGKQAKQVRKSWKRRK